VLALSVIFCLLLIRSFIINSVSLPEAVDMRGESEISVVLREEGFVPDRVRVSAGTKVVFSTTRDRQFWPASNPHPAHTIYDAFDPQQPIASDETWTFVAEQDGVWGFHDHLRSYYTGILYVEAP
jgi:plastocyanin